MDVLGRLPAYEGRKQTIARRHTLDDIIDEVCRAHYVFADHYDRIAGYFYDKDIERLCRSLFDYCKDNLPYREEPEDKQTTRSPAAVLERGVIDGVDCKHYAGFIAGVLDACKRLGLKVDWCYRFVSYDMFDSAPGHVFVVVKDKGRELFVDPVLDRFDQRSPMYYFKKDKRCNMLQRISGIGVAAGYPPPADSYWDGSLGRYVEGTSTGRPVRNGSTGTASNYTVMPTGLARESEYVVEGEADKDDVPGAGEDNAVKADNRNKLYWLLLIAGAVLYWNYKR